MPDFFSATGNTFLLMEEYTGLEVEFQYPYPSSVYSVSTPSTSSNNHSPRPSKKQKVAGHHNNNLSNGRGTTKKNQMQANEDASAEDLAAASKPKRVRTGCLTCRERHLKCDEGLPNCQNCRKSSRVCKRGVRLNFIDTQVKDPQIIPPTADWSVQFQDESREIASEYKGGLSRYTILDRSLEVASEYRGGSSRYAVDQTITPPREPPFDYHARPMVVESLASDNALPPIQPTAYNDGGLTVKQEQSHQRHASQHSRNTSENTFLQLTSPYGPEQTLTAPNEVRDYLNTTEEVLFMQVFVEEVGIWMDSMDSMKHFSRLLPFHSLGEPMLLNAFLACGARHLTLVNPMYHEDKALYYYDTATTQLLRSLQNPDRDTVVCATTAVILNVYEIMSERAMQRMNHIAGARALIKECGWNARSTGIGAACFWLNVGMELLSCLHFNWQVAWDPDQWGLDMDFQRETEVGREEIWVHRMLYIIGKIANFRASVPRFQEASPHDEQIRSQARYAEWQRLRSLCESWNNSIPRTMHPMGKLHPSQTTSKSSFPEIWLIKRSTIIGRLFYHTAMCLLPQINPIMSKGTDEMRRMQLEHAHSICGIVAHVKDRGVASVAIRSLAIASECLVIRHEQEEVLEVFEKIRKETGWKVGFIGKELKSKWGWVDGEAAQAQMLAQQNPLAQFFPPTTQAQASTSLPPAPPPARPMPAGILNPLLKTADFSHPNHPYQQYYQPPNQHSSYSHNYL